ncbi:hypothetical protein F4861DRAFT_6089 [Xylaria intraflava]|nr:hypothetical protein F4861DRAFT_6089 [Xylaria intraflava]
MDDYDANVDSQPDQYARDNLLSLDSQVDPFSLVLQINGPLPQPTLDAGSDALTSDSFLPQFHPPTLHLREQLDMPMGTIELLTRALRHEDININGQSETPLAQYDTRKRLAGLKFESPALVSDPDFDCRELARTIQECRRPDYGPEMFPSERLNVAMDEGLEFPDSAYCFGRTLSRVARHEKLDVPKEAVYRLARGIEDDWSDDNVREVLEEAMPCRIFLRDLVVTPPLSPFVQSEEHFIPDTEVCEVPIASDSSSMLSDDVKEAESVIVQRVLEEGVSPIVDIDTPQLSPLLGHPTLSKELTKIRSVKMESPLSPSIAPSYTNEGPTIPALLKSMDMDHTLSSPGCSKINVGQIDGMDSMFGQNSGIVIEEIATAVIRNIQQEQIDVAGATARVSVPTMDFLIPAPEWENLPMDVGAHLKWLLGKNSIEIPLCSKDSRLDSQLRWIPFWQKIDLQTLTEETIDCERDLSQLLEFSNVQEAPTSANYVWKRPGLAILREPESEEEVVDVTPTVKSVCHLAGLARKRRLEHDSLETEMSSAPKSNLTVNCAASSQKKRPLRRIEFNHTSLLPGTESNLAVSTLLSNYIDIRTSKRRKQSQSSFFSPALKPGAEPPLGLGAETSQSRGGIACVPKITEQPEKHVTLQAPCPEVNTLNMPTKLIKGLSLSRSLFSHLEQFCPTAEIIERDFDRWDKGSWDPYSWGSTVASSVAAEADVIVSAATGIIVTTLLKVIQKPLPGHGGQSSIRERIGRVALRYERLVVLVSEGNAVDETVRGLAPSETTAYAEFVCFAAGLGTKVEVFYVGGGELTLAKWLVHFAIQHAPEAVEVQAHLTQDETQWEVFLRRMGFNAYAAQAILARLRESDDECLQESKCPIRGLAAFMMMSTAKREERFRDLIGGGRVLGRVSRMLEAGWN